MEGLWPAEGTGPRVLGLLLLLRTWGSERASHWDREAEARLPLAAPLL